uniref:Uncharacterized protein n=1 Tax=Arundo donax TaxID=35708 RepID=A0A0A9DZB0_ARUDO
MCCISFHISTNSQSCCGDFRLLTLLIQLSFVSSCWTILFLKCTSLYRLGAWFFSGTPCNHASCQNFALHPSPICMCVEALNNAASPSSHGRFNPFHGRSSSIHCAHSHLILSALANFSRSRTPSPPNSLGLQTVLQFTKQAPPLFLSSSAPFQMKFLLILSIFLNNHFGMCSTVAW